MICKSKVAKTFRSKTNVLISLTSGVPYEFRGLHSLLTSKQLLSVGNCGGSLPPFSELVRRYQIAINALSGNRRRPRVAKTFRPNWWSGP